MLRHAVHLMSLKIRCFLVLSLLALLLACVSAHALDYDIQGIEDSTLRNNITLHLATLDIDAQQLDDPFWQDELKKTVSTALEPFGYYNSNTHIAQNDQGKFVLSISLNDPLVIANITREIIGPGRSDPGFRNTFDALAMNIGDVLKQTVYSDFKTAMFNYALSHGYFDFHWQATRLDLVRSAKEANVLLIAQSGQRYQFGELRIVGEDKAKAIIERLRPFESGQPYSAAQLNAFNRVLNQSGYFDRVIARPIVSEANGLLVPIEVSVTHRPTDAFNVSLGAATDTGPRIRFGWERPWVNARGHAVSSDIFVSQPEQSVTLNYHIPMKNVTTDAIRIEGGYQFIEYANTNFESETLSIAGHRLWQKEGSPWQQDASLTFLEETYDQITLTNNTTSLILPGYAISYQYKDDPLNINHGHYINVAAQLGSAKWGSDIDFAKLVVSAVMVRSYALRHRITLRGNVGALDTNDFARVPASIRFYAGGDQSIRGFDFREISPTQDVTNPTTGETLSEAVGGKYLITSSIEYAYTLAENWRVALFSDVGTASDTIDADLSYSVGTGAHWVSPIGPVRVYIARGFTPNNGNTWRFHLILGPEL